MSRWRSAVGLPEVLFDKPESPYTSRWKWGDPRFPMNALKLLAVTGVDSPLTATTFRSKVPPESKLGSVLTPAAKPHADTQSALTTSYDICRLIDSATFCRILHNRAGWDNSRWDQQPIHGDDLLKRSPTKITVQLRCHSCWLSLGSTVHSRRRLPEARLHQNQSSAVAAPETKSDVYARRRPAGVVIAQWTRISALSSTAPHSVTSSATEQDGALTLLAVTRVDTLLTMTTS